jgi:SAM-dependent methyltransferase
VQRLEVDADDGPLVDDHETIAQLRAVLADAGFTPAAVREALATEVSTSRESPELPLYVRLLPEGSRLSTLIKLFLIGLTATTDEARTALAPLSLEQLERMGLIAVADDTVKGRFELTPIDDLVIASAPFLEELARPEHVLGISPPARVLASLTVRLPVEDVLDLGTGNGIQALFAARHARCVTAVDINPRALRFAEFNAVLNDAAEIEFREGNLFEPVEGSTFDAIVCNPPYVISPETEFIYRDSGVQGDAFCEHIVRLLPAYLRPGGFAHILVSWVHKPAADWSEPLRRWVTSTGCDAVLLRYSTHEPLQYAAGWNRPLRGDAAAYGAALDRWTGHFAELGIEAISWGAIILRRRVGENWVWAYSPSSDRVTPASDHVLRLFDAQDFLNGLDDEALLTRPLVLTGDHRLDQTGRLDRGERIVDRTVLRLDGGLGTEVAIDSATVKVLSLLDGRRTLGDALTAAAATGNADERQFVANALPVVRRLVELGFLLLA